MDDDRCEVALDCQPGDVHGRFTEDDEGLVWPKHEIRASSSLTGLCVDGEEDTAYEVAGRVEDVDPVKTACIDVSALVTLDPIRSTAVDDVEKPLVVQTQTIVLLRQDDVECVTGR